VAKRKKRPLLYFDRVATINSLLASGYTLEEARTYADDTYRWISKVLHQNRMERRYSRRSKGYASR